MSFLKTFAVGEGVSSKLGERTPRVRKINSQEDVFIYEGLRSEVLLCLAEKGTRVFLVSPELRGILHDVVFLADLVAFSFVADDGERGEDLWFLKEDIPSAAKAATKATGKWARIEWQTKGKRGYRVGPPAAEHDDPDWPHGDFDAFAEAAFGDRVITTLNDAIAAGLIEPDEAERRLERAKRLGGSHETSPDRAKERGRSSREEGSPQAAEDGDEGDEE